MFSLEATIVLRQQGYTHFKTTCDGTNYYRTWALGRRKL